MANDSYLNLTGETQGNIEGSCDIEGQEGKIDIYGWSHEVIAPRDVKSGLPTGQRQHKPFTITKPVDKATPLLMAVIVRNENVTEWKLECWRPSSVGAPEQFYSAGTGRAVRSLTTYAKQVVVPKSMPTATLISAPHTTAPGVGVGKTQSAPGASMQHHCCIPQSRVINKFSCLAVWVEAG